VREVVDSEGSTIVSNEIFHLEIEDGLVTGFPMREQTRKLLTAHGLGADISSVQKSEDAS
jgi:hypothetical protein